MNNVGVKIKEIRKQNNLTQLEFSEKLGVSRPFISQIETGKYQPSKSLILLISYVFKVSQDSLLDK